MGYMTLGADGRVRPDEATSFARGFLAPVEQEGRVQEIFPGAVELGKKKKKKGFGRFFKKSIARKLKVTKKLMKLTPHGMLVSKFLFKKKGKKKRGAPMEETEETEESTDVGPVSESPAPEGESIEARTASEEAAPRSRDIEEEREYPSPPPVERRTRPSEPVEESAPEAAPPFEEETPRGAPVEAEPEEVPESNIEGNTVGGWLVTKASPTPHAFGYRRRWEKSLERKRGARVPQAYKPPARRPVPSTWASAFERQGVKVKGVRLPFDRPARGLRGLGQDMSALISQADSLVEHGRSIIGAVQRAINQDRASAEKWRDPNWWQTGIRFALEIPPQMIELAKWDRPINTAKNGISRFLETYATALDASGTEGERAVSRLGNVIDGFRLYGPYTVGALGNIRHMKKPSIVKYIEDEAMGLNRKTQAVIDASFRAAKAIPEAVAKAAEAAGEAAKGIPGWLWLLGVVALGASVIGAFKK